MTTLNVQDYGAEGDGVTDDTSAIQSAINDAGRGDTVWFPQPDEYYKVTLTGREYCLRTREPSNNVTFEGETLDTEIRMADGEKAADGYDGIVWIFSSGDGYSGVEIRSLTINGNQANQPASSPDEGGECLKFNASGSNAAGETLVKDCTFKNSIGSGTGTHYGGVTWENCTTKDTGSHGWTISTQWTGVHSPAPIIRNCLALRPSSVGWGRYGFDLRGGLGEVYDSVVKDSGFGGFKMSVEADKNTWKRVRVTGAEGIGFQQTGDPSNDVYFEDIVIENCDYSGFRFSGDHTTYHISGELLAHSNTQVDDSNSVANIFITNEAVINAENATFWAIDAASEQGLVSNTDGHAHIGIYNYDDNARGMLGSDSNLTIDERNNQRLEDITGVPTADEVGAGMDRSDETEDSEEDKEQPFEEWTPRWESSADDWNVVSGSEFEGGHALRFNHEGNQRTRYAISWDTAGESSDVEILDKFRVPSFTDDEDLGFHARAHLRSSTSNGLSEGYWIEVENRNDAFRLGKYTDGRLVTLERFGAPVEDSFFYRRFRAEGNELKAKIWLASENEPETWDVETTDTDHSSGWVGLGSFDTEIVETDVFSVGTGGKSAELPVSEDSLSISLVAPADGEVLSGTENIRIDTDNSEDSSIVEYRINDGSWLAVSHNSETGYYEDDWDSTGITNGEHVLEARIIDSSDNTSTDSISIVVENSISIDSIGTEDVNTSSATLVGELTSLGTDSEVTGYFEWREVDNDTWNVTDEQILDSTGTFHSRIEDLNPSTKYEFRAAGTDSVTGETLRFDTTSSDDEESSLSIDQFDVTNKSNPVWRRFDVDWAVSDKDGNLDTVVTKLQYEGTTVAAETTNITGETASYSHILRVQGDVDEVRLSINDTSNQTLTMSKDV